jgi:predicted NBD/HSP70 family sugar kinase
MLIGIDWGGTKIEGVAMERDGREVLRLREATPRHDYHGCLKTIRSVIEALEAQTRRRGSVGIGIPGSLEPKSRLGKGASSTWILGSVQIGSVQILSHIFSSDGGFGWVFLGLKQWPHVHVPFR